MQPREYAFHFTAFCICGWIMQMREEDSTVYCVNPSCKCCMTMFKVAITLEMQKTEKV